MSHFLHRLFDALFLNFGRFSLIYSRFALSILSKTACCGDFKSLFRAVLQLSFDIYVNSNKPGIINYDNTSTVSKFDSIQHEKTHIGTSCKIHFSVPFQK